jgi:hypothetical protein
VATPNPVQRSFGDQLIHLATANTAYFSAFGLMPMPERVTAADKAEIEIGLFRGSVWAADESPLSKLCIKRRKPGTSA